MTSEDHFGQLLTTDWTVTFLGNKNQPKGTLEAEDMFTVGDRVDRYVGILASQCRDTTLQHACILQQTGQALGGLPLLGTTSLD